LDYSVSGIEVSQLFRLACSFRSQTNLSAIFVNFRPDYYYYDEHSSCGYCCFSFWSVCHSAFAWLS